MENKYNIDFETPKLEQRTKRKSRKRSPLVRSLIWLVTFSFIAIVVIILFLIVIEFVDLEKIFLGLKM